MGYKKILKTQLKMNIKLILLVTALVSASYTKPRRAGIVADALHVAEEGADLMGWRNLNNKKGIVADALHVAEEGANLMGWRKLNNKKGIVADALHVAEEGANLMGWRKNGIVADTLHL